MKSIRLNLRLSRLLACRRLVLASLLTAGLGWCLSATAATVYTATLNGPSEDPPNDSPGIGTAIVTHDPVARTLTIDVTFSGLLGQTTVAHIHASTALPLTGNIGVAVMPGTLLGFPVGVTSGSYLHTLDLAEESTYTSAFVNNFGGGTTDGAEAALVDALNTKRAYFNIHTEQFPPGEIRGFLAPARTPEGGAPLIAFAAVLGALSWFRRQIGTP